jgi:hypothetical protein
MVNLVPLWLLLLGRRGRSSFLRLPSTGRVVGLVPMLVPRLLVLVVVPGPVSVRASSGAIATLPLVRRLSKHDGGQE